MTDNVAWIACVIRERMVVLLFFTNNPSANYLSLGSFDGAPIPMASGSYFKIGGAKVTTVISFRAKISSTRASEYCSTSQSSCEWIYVYRS